MNKDHFTSSKISNILPQNGLTPLHLCAQEDRVNVATILVNNKCEIDPQTKAGYTPLHIGSFSKIALFY